MGVASLVAAGVLGIGGAALFAAPVSADSSGLTAGAVNFDGNCGLLGIAAQSVPNRQSMQINSSDQVTFVNDLPCNAHLYVNNQRVAAVDRGASQPLSVGDATDQLAPGGSSQIKMVPDGVGLLTSVRAVTISVTDPPADTNNSNSTSSGSTSSGSGSGDSGQSGTTDNSGQESGSSSGSHHSSNTDQGSDGATATVPDRGPNGGASPTAPKVHDPVARGAVPSSAAAAGAGSGTSGGSGEASDPSTSEHHAVADARPVSSVTPARATSVLALIAAVCLAGVGVAAIRTTFTQRHHGSANA